MLSAIAATGVLGWSSACAWLDDVPIQDLGDTSGGLGAPTPEPPPDKESIEQIDLGARLHLRPRARPVGRAARFVRKHRVIHVLARAH